MKLLTKNVTPLIYGTWILRVTNDNSIENCLNYLEICDEPIIKLKTVKQEKLFGTKKSRTAYINNINYISPNNFNFTITYSKKNTYSYSFLGIEIPEIKSNSIDYNKEKNLSVIIYDKTLLITDNLLCFYYVFDLYIGKIKYPNAETNLSTFLFTQLISILLSIMISKLL